MIRSAVVFLGIVLVLTGCRAPLDAGRKGLITGDFLSEPEVQRVADLMARDMVREPIFYGEGPPPRIAVIKIENNTNQYLFRPSRHAYLERLRTQLKRALKKRVRFVDQDMENRLREELQRWHLDEEPTAQLAQRKRARHGVDYFLAATFDSLDKVVHVADKKGTLNDQKIVELQMTFSLVDTETGELQWQNSVASAAVFTTRAFQD